MDNIGFNAGGNRDRTRHCLLIFTASIRKDNKKNDNDVIRKRTAYINLKRVINVACDPKRSDRVYVAAAGAQIHR
jgi:hypothetical protein